MKCYLLVVLICISLLFCGCQITNSAGSESSVPDISNVVSNAATGTVVRDEPSSSNISLNEVSNSSSERNSGSQSRKNKIMIVSSDLESEFEETHSESNEEPKIESKKEGEEIHIGDKITTEFGEMSIESYKISKTFDYTIIRYDGSTSPVSISADSGKTYIIFTGIYKNTSGDRCYPIISPEDVLINDNYNYRYLFFEDDKNLGISILGGLDPLESNRYYGRIEVPDEMADLLKKCEIRFWFYGSLSNDYFGQHYRLVITR